MNAASHEEAVMFEASHPFAFFDYFRVPYRASSPAAGNGRSPAAGPVGWLRPAGSAGKPAGSAGRAAGAGGGTAPRPGGRGPPPPPSSPPPPPGRRPRERPAPRPPTLPIFARRTTHTPP